MLKEILIVVGILFLIGVVLVTRDYDSPELGNAILARVGEATDMEITATGFRLNLLKGLVLEGVEIHQASEGRTMDVSVAELVFEHQVLPLLSGTVAVKQILLRDPQVEVVETEGAGASGGEAGREKN